MNETDQRIHLDRLLCDEMLQGLARWLRAAGYDTATVERGTDDRGVVESALEEDRMLLSRDRHLRHYRRLQGHLLLLRGNEEASIVAELNATTDINWMRAPLTRCMRCNGVLRRATVEELTRIPSGSRDCVEVAWVCPDCGRIYWRGAHVPKILRKLEYFQSLEPMSR